MSFILFIILVLLFAALFVVGIGLSILGQLLGGVGNAYRLVKQALGFGKAQRTAGFGNNGRQSASGFGNNGRQSASGFGNANYSGGRQQGRTDSRGDAWTEGAYESSSTKKGGSAGKVFKQSEGEYIDFEEIK